MSETKMSGNWKKEKEDYSFIRSLSRVPMSTPLWKAFARPAEVDIKWHRNEDQGQIGSCQGHSLSSVLERLALVRGETVQLSEIFAYLSSQKLDGLLGSDDGSTISGGCQVGLEYGCCPESLTGYPSGYPRRADREAILSAANYEAALPYKALSLWEVPDDHDKVLDFIGGGGAINFGIAYYDGYIPDDRIVRSYQPRRSGGGHAMCVLGYDKDGNLRAANSWADGGYLITPKAWKQMIEYSDTAAIGLMGNKEAVPVDWYNNSPYYKMRLKPD